MQSERRAEVLTALMEISRKQAELGPIRSRDVVAIFVESHPNLLDSIRADLVAQGLKALEIVALRRIASPQDNRQLCLEGFERVPLLMASNSRWITTEDSSLSILKARKRKIARLLRKRPKVTPEKKAERERAWAELKKENEELTGLIQLVARYNRGTPGITVRESRAAEAELRAAENRNVARAKRAGAKRWAKTNKAKS